MAPCRLPAAGRLVMPSLASCPGGWPWQRPGLTPGEGLGIEHRPRQRTGTLAQCTSPRKPFKRGRGSCSGTIPVPCCRATPSCRHDVTAGLSFWTSGGDSVELQKYYIFQLTLSQHDVTAGLLFRTSGEDSPELQKYIFSADVVSPSKVLQLKLPSSQAILGQDTSWD